MLSFHFYHKYTCRYFAKKMCIVSNQLARYQKMDITLYLNQNNVNQIFGHLQKELQKNNQINTVGKRYVYYSTNRHSIRINENLQT